MTAPTGVVECRKRTQRIKNSLTNIYVLDLISHRLFFLFFGTYNIIIILFKNVGKKFQKRSKKFKKSGTLLGVSRAK